MPLAIVLLVGGLSVYFLLAAFLTDWRMRWAWMTLFSFGQQRATKEHRRKPRMGRLSRFGLGLFLAAFPILYFGISWHGIPTVASLVALTGIVLGLGGQYRDRALAGQGWEHYKSRKNEG